MQFYRKNNTKRSFNGSKCQIKKINISVNNDCLKWNKGKEVSPLKSNKMNNKSVGNKSN